MKLLRGVEITGWKEGVVRLIQAILLVTGAPALGAMVCGLGLATVADAACRTRPGQDPSLDWGGAVAFLGSGICGSAFGAIVGLLRAARWLRLHGREPWQSSTWVGVVLCTVAAAAVRFSGVLDQTAVAVVLKWWPSTVAFLAAFGTIGGLLGSTVGTRTGARGR